MNSIRPTRFPELGYRMDGPGLWRIYDTDTESAVGPQYATKAELLADLERYARDFFFFTASRPACPGCGWQHDGNCAPEMNEA